MRQFIGILCSTALLTAAACSKTPEGQAPESVNAGSEDAAAAESYYTVEAHDIPHANANITAVQGTFAMVPAPAGTGIPSSGLGGACLVFTAKDLGFTAMDAKKCTTNQDCYHAPEDPTATGANAYKASSYVPASDPTHRENSYGYCDTQNKQCWSKPIGGPGSAGEPPVCNRPIKMTAGTVNALPKKPPAPGPGAMPVDVSKWVKPGARVRVVACLNKGGPTFPGKPPCGEIVSADRIEVMGKPTPLHK